MVATIVEISWFGMFPGHSQYNYTILKPLNQASNICMYMIDLTAV